MVWRALAIVVIAVHFAYLAFVPFGGFLAWRWPRLVWAHLAALAWALGSISVHYDCPLTGLEDALDRHTGDHPNGQFVDRYVKGYVVPHGHDGAVQLAVVGLIVVSYVGFFTRRRRARRSSALPRSRAAAPAPGTPPRRRPADRP